MNTKASLAVCTLCAIFFMVNSLPLEKIITKTGKIYQLVPVDIVSRNLHRARRDVFPENINDEQEAVNKEAGTNHETLIKTTEKGDEGVSKEKKLEVLKTAADFIYPVVYRVRRAYQDKRRYENNDDYYDDGDYAGEDRKGSAVGYMDDDDDFPTVVW